jgi:enoyl-CoA hydratase
VTEQRSTDLLVERRGPVAIVRLNRPAEANAVNASLHAALATVWDELRADGCTRAVVLTGQGRAFSAGGDMDWLAGVASDPDERRSSLAEARTLVERMLACPLPVIAAVNGAAVGLGCSIAGLCDIVFMGQEAYFADPHVAIGLVAGDGAALTWPFLTSLLRAKQYIFTGDRIDAATAERFGLANAVYPADELLPAALALAERLAALPAQALQDSKRALNMHVQRVAPGLLDFAVAAESESFTTAEHRERVEAFRGQRRRAKVAQ